MEQVQPVDYERQFKQELYKAYEKNKRNLIPKEAYNQTIDDLKTISQDKSTKTRHEYYILNRYEVLLCGDIEKLIKKRENEKEQPVYYVSIEDTYDVIKKAHIATGHGGRDRMTKHLSNKYANISRDALNLFKSYCATCQEKTKRPVSKGVVVRPILTEDMNSRGQVDLIDMQSKPQHTCKWILVYQCHLTKFVVIRPITSKRAAEVESQLLDIFLLFGAPAILQSDNGSEFTASVIQELKVMWPQLTMIHGRPRHPQSQGSVERANGDIKDMLVSWMSDNRCQDWTIGIKFVQHMKNTSYHAGIKRSPYTAMFCTEPKVGLTSSSNPDEIITRLESEEDLLRTLSMTDQQQDQQPDQQKDQSDQQQDQQPDQQKDQSDQQPGPSDQQQDQQPDQSDQQQEHGYVEVRRQNIIRHRKQTRECLANQAERMVKRSRIELQPGSIGDNVAVPVPTVDRGRGDPRNILGVIVNRSDNDLYTIATKQGILNTKYTRVDITLCQQRLLKETDIETGKHVSIREILKSSVTGGQGYIKCNCAALKSKCTTIKCKCFKAELKCNSRCHNSLSCNNK